MKPQAFHYKQLLNDRNRANYVIIVLLSVFLLVVNFLLINESSPEYRLEFYSVYGVFLLICALINIFGRLIGVMQ